MAAIITVGILQNEHDYIINIVIIPNEVKHGVFSNLCSQSEEIIGIHMTIQSVESNGSFDGELYLIAGYQHGRASKNSTQA